MMMLAMGSHANSIAMFCRQNELPWSSACSGTDAPAWVFRSIRDTLGKRGCVVKFPHHTAAELVAAKRDFIAKVAPPKHLLVNMWDYVVKEPYCCIMRKLVPAALISAGRIYIAGFSCKDASTLRRGRASGTGVEDSSGTTGVTFAVVIHTLMRHKPLLFILEMCWGFYTK